jgi:hypothetical protein
VPSSRSAGKAPHGHHRPGVGRGPGHRGGTGDRPVRCGDVAPAPPGSASESRAPPPVTRQGCGAPGNPAKRVARHRPCSQGGVRDPSPARRRTCRLDAKHPQAASAGRPRLHIRLPMQLCLRQRSGCRIDAGKGPRFGQKDGQ